jgi:hypothetical protein
MSIPMLGRDLERIPLRIVRGSTEGFGLHWYDSFGDPLDLSGISVLIRLESGTEWVATLSLPTAKSTWVIGPSDIAPLPQKSRGWCVITDGTDEVVAFAVDVEVQQ